MEPITKDMDIKRGMSLKTNFTLQVVSICTLMALMVIMLIQVRISQHRLELDQAKATLCQLLATEVKQSSEDLTRACRMFIVSGGSKTFLDEYNGILGWRSGTAPRPSNLPANMHPG